MISLPLVSSASMPIQNEQSSSYIFAAAKISKQQAAKIAQKRVAGRVLKVTLKKSTYRVKIVSKSGDVISVLVNANNGKIIN